MARLRHRCPVSSGTALVGLPDYMYVVDSCAWSGLQVCRVLVSEVLMRGGCGGVLDADWIRR